MINFSHCLATAKVQFQAEANALHAVGVKPDIVTRLKQVNELIESYLAVTGLVPDHNVLGWLANYLLVDVLADQYKHFRKDEYPIQSKNQITKRRHRHRQIQFNEEIG